MTRFGRYQLLRRLGEGGMGEVFLARLSGEAGFEKLLVVKRIHPVWQRDPAFIEMFLDEARVAARLNHPNIAQIFELGEVDGVHFLAMEYVAGVNLARLAAAAAERKRPLPVSVVCRVVADAAAGLANAHRALGPDGKALGLVHRDVSPQNVLVGFDGAVKLIDFGVAKAAGRLQETNPGVLRGKYAYMSPEQVDGEELDARSDVFSLGIVLWEQCTGKRLFKADTEAVTLRKVAECQVPKPSSLAPDLPPGLEEVCLRALARRREDRFGDAEAMRQAVEPLATNTATLERYVRDLFAQEIAELSRPYPKDDAEEAGASKPALREAGPSTQAIGPPGTEVGASSSGVGDPAPRPRRSAGEGAASTQPGGPVPEHITRSISAPGGDDDTSADLIPGLRAPRTTFVGREADLERLGELVHGEGRLVTVVGPGGTGKTRLAVEFARHERRSGAGVWFCDLTEARTVEGVCAAAAGVLEVPLGGARRDLPTLVGEALAGCGRALLVLDNFEQVVSHAAATVGRWAALAPRTRMLVTSREPLRLPGEALLELAPLPLPPTPEEVAGSDAGRLFLDRAASARPGYELTSADAPAVAELLRALDGIPLAIELAASRMAVMTAAQLSSRLSRRFELLRSTQRTLSGRQATLRGAIDWSWELLDPVERSALAQCSVFRGGFSLEAAEAVLAVDPAGPLALDVLQSLRDKSLLRTYAPPADAGLLRFGLYETIREYAAQKLGELGIGAAVEDRHRRYFLEEATRLAEKLNTAEGARALRLLSLELENVLAVHERAMRAQPPSTEDLVAAVRALVALDPVVVTRGPLGFFNGLLGRTLAAAAPGQLPDALRALALVGYGGGLRLLGKIAEAGTAFDEGLAAARAAADPALEARLHAGRGVFFHQAGRLDDARAEHRMAIELGRASAPYWQALALGNLAVLETRLGHLDVAEAAMNEALPILKRLGARHREAVISGNLGAVYGIRGQFEDCRRHLERALVIHREFEARHSEALVLGSLAALAGEEGKNEQGLPYAEAALAIARRLGMRQTEGNFLGRLGGMLHECGRLDEAATHYDESIATLDEAGDARLGSYFRALKAAIEAKRGRVTEARALLDRAQELAKPIGDPLVLAAVELNRAHLDLAQAREARAAGDVARAEALRAAAEERAAQVERPGIPKVAEAGEAPSMAASSSELRVVLRVLRRELRS